MSNFLKRIGTAAFVTGSAATTFFSVATLSEESGLTYTKNSKGCSTRILSYPLISRLPSFGR